LFALVGLADDGALRVELWIIGIGARERLLDCFGRCRAGQPQNSCGNKRDCEQNRSGGRLLTPSLRKVSPRPRSHNPLTARPNRRTLSW